LNCLATVRLWGAGCGGHTVQATTPWLGSTLRTTGSAPVGATVVVVVNGFGPASLPGCTLLVTADYVTFG
jgi:hypothetical protein